MSREHVQAFYDRLATDETFRTRIEKVNSKAECTLIVREAGYYFTDAEYEEYTTKLLNFGVEGELKDLEEKELEAVFGGASKMIGRPRPQLKYGGVIIDKHDCDWPYYK